MMVFTACGFGILIVACTFATKRIHAFAPAFSLPTRTLNPLTKPRLPDPASYPSTPGSSFLSLQSPTSLKTSTNGIELVNLLYDDTSMAFDAWEWTANLGAPAALVAGAVLVTLSETREDMGPRRSDKHWVRILKQTCRFLLLTSFALEVVSIFVGTITGSVLLSHGDQVAKKMVGYRAPLALLHHHHELNYLTCKITFLQGLLNWIGAVAIEILLPKRNETRSARRMNKCMASCLITLVFWILAFYNNHLSFYSDYGSMLRRFWTLFAKEYFTWPIRPMSLLYAPSSLASVVLIWRAFRTPPELDEEDDDENEKTD